MSLSLYMVCVKDLEAVTEAQYPYLANDWVIDNGLNPI